MRGGSENLHDVERFTPQVGGDVLYNFTVEDDTVWTAPWAGEYLWRASDQRVYEYACHEGNYAMGNILRGARLLEAEAVEHDRDQPLPSNAARSTRARTPKRSRARS